MLDSNKPIVSRLSSKGQTTVPQEIREYLDLDEGDLLNYMIEDERVILKKTQLFDIEYYKSLEKTLDKEWSSKEDSAYDDL